MPDEQVTETQEPEATEPEAVEVDLEAENADLRAMLGHYAGDIDIDSLIQNNFSRAGKFIPPKQEVEAKEEPKPKQAATIRKPVTRRVPEGRTTTEAKPRVAGEISLGRPGNLSSVESFELSKSLQAMKPEERAAILAGVKVSS